jgi:hypothetical protein
MAEFWFEKSSDALFGLEQVSSIMQAVIRRANAKVNERRAVRYAMLHQESR